MLGSPKVWKVVVLRVVDCLELTDMLLWLSLSFLLEEIKSMFLSLQEIPERKCINDWVKLQNSIKS